jgi:hypothetical protein
MSKTINLRAQVVSNRDEGLEIYDEQTFEVWNQSQRVWKVWEKKAEDFKDILKTPQYEEIQLQPLILTEANRKTLANLFEKGADGVSLHRQFYSRGLRWELDTTRRLTWKLDGDDIMYTIFEKGVWTDDVEFKEPNPTDDFSGRCLTSLKLRSSKIPRNLDFTSCNNSDFDGVRKLTSFRGAHIHGARFHGESRLKESDLSSTICYATHFDFPTQETTDIFKNACLEGAAFIDSAKFTFKSDKLSNKGNQDNDRYDLGSEWLGLRKFFIALSKDDETLLKHKDEISFVVDELERLRRYEVRKDNWQEILDSWSALCRMELSSAKAKQVRKHLCNKEVSTELMAIGQVLYEILGDPPHGLLIKIKKHVGVNLLRNTAYSEQKKELTDEISNIQVIMGAREQLVTVRQNILLSVFFFIANYFSTILADQFMDQ